MSKNSSIALIGLYGLSLLFFLLAMSGAAADLTSSAYDWDLDTEMYFGWRTLNGELVWFKEFHDKLPFLSYLFVIPALFESITPWLLISIAVSTTTSVVLAVVGYALSMENGLDTRFAWANGTLVGSIYLYMIAMSPGGFATINAFAAGLSTIAFSLTLIRLPTAQKKSNLLVDYSVVVLLAMSISVRPYFVAPVVVLVIFSSVYSRFRTTYTGARRSITPRACKEAGASALIRLVAIAGFTVLINALPYATSGQMDAFLSGVQMLAQDLNPRSSVASIVGDLGLGQFIFWLQLLLLVTVALMSVKWRWPLWQQQIAIGLATISLLLIVVRTHWFPHYYALFSGLLALQIMVASVSLSVKFRLRADRPKSPQREPVVLLLVVPYALFGITGAVSEFRSVSTDSRPSSASHSDSSTVKALKEFFEENYDRRPTFLYPHSSYVHWKMREPRHGLPHAAHTDHIAEGWWNGVVIPPRLNLPSNLDEYCILLEEAPIDNLVLFEGSPIHVCVDRAVKLWGPPTSITTQTGLNLQIFERS